MNLVLRGKKFNKLHHLSLNWIAEVKEKNIYKRRPFTMLYSGFGVPGKWTSLFVPAK